MRYLVALLSAICLIADAQEVSSIRDSQHEWACETENGGFISGHTRQDKAFQSCYNAALSDPGRIYIVRGGTFRVTANAGSATPPPTETPTDPPVDPPSDSADPVTRPQVTFGPIAVPVEYEGISAFRQDRFRWEITANFNDVTSGKRQGIVSRDESGQNDKGHLSVWFDAGYIHVRNQDKFGNQPSINLKSSTGPIEGEDIQITLSVADGIGIGLWINGELEDWHPNAFGLADNNLPLLLCANRSRHTLDQGGNVGIDNPLDGTCYLEIWDDDYEISGPLSADLQWEAPTRYEDDEPIEINDLSDYRIYMTEPESIHIATVEGDVTGYEYVTTTQGRHCFYVTAVARTKESQPSNTACKTL